MLDRSWVLIAAVLLCCSICALAETFNPAKLRLIDFDLGFQNYLFRSNSPMTSNDTFAYDELVAAMADEASQANATLPEHFFIVDLSLLNELLPAERHDLETEKAFFAAHPDLGLVINWPLVGMLTDPQDYPADVRKELALALPHTMLDRLPARVPFIYESVHAASEHGPTVFLIHCEGGCDRTGELSGSYELANLGGVYGTVVATNDLICGRNESYTTSQALDWFCYYLFYSKGFVLNCDLPH